MYLHAVQHIVQNPRMEQPLADVYFLVVFEHMVGERSADLRLEAVLKKLSDVNEVCLGKDK